jgi:hypothetical protein
LPLFITTPAVAQSHTLGDVGSLFCNANGQLVLKPPSSSTTISNHTLWWLAAIHHYDSLGNPTGSHWSDYAWFAQPLGWSLLVFLDVADPFGRVDADIYIYDEIDQQWWYYATLTGPCTFCNGALGVKSLTGFPVIGVSLLSVVGLDVAT